MEEQHVECVISGIDADPELLIRINIVDEKLCCL